MSDSPAPKKPLITANQVTFLRLALMPIPWWLLYQGQRGQFGALILATILGCTDFVDGYLARKHGSTVLGSLMDPIADKVFIAVAFLPAVDLKWVPAWMVALLFVREFLVTAARTVYEHRGQQLKSTYFARYKTWVQMCGIGVLMLTHSVSDFAVDVFLATCAVLPMLAYAIRFIVARKTWKGAAAFAVSFTGLFVLHFIYGNDLTSIALMGFIVGVTWVSGLGYFTGIGSLMGKGKIRGGELVRLFASLALPILAVFAQTANVAPRWAIVALVSLELAHGGLDNLLAHHHAEQGGWGWFLRLGAENGLLLAGLLWPPLSYWGCIIAASLGALGLAVAFVQKRAYYIGPKGDKLRAVKSGPADDAAKGAKASTA